MKADARNCAPTGKQCSNEEWQEIAARSKAISENHIAEIAAIPGKVLNTGQMRIWRSLGGEPMRTAEISPAAFPPPPRG
jgi:hypothetical protein